MGADISLVALEGVARRFGRVPKSLQKECVRALHEAGPKIERDIKGAASTKIMRRASHSVEMTRHGEGITLRGGYGVGLDAVLFPGGEYGGKKSKKVIYSTRSRIGTAYVVRRRTTMQFEQWNGQEGYFFWPTIREWMPKLIKEQEETINKVMGGR